MSGIEPEPHTCTPPALCSLCRLYVVIYRDHIKCVGGGEEDTAVRVLNLAVFGVTKAVASIQQTRWCQG